MNISFFSFLMSVLFSTVFILMIHLLRNRPLFLKSFGVHALLVMYGLCLFRMIFVIELPFTIPLGFKGAFSHTYSLLRKVQVSVGRSRVDIIDVLLSIWIIAAMTIFIRLIWQESVVRKRLSPFRRNKNYTAEQTLEKVKELSSRQLPVRVCVCPDIDIPMGLGIFQRWIYLPDEEYGEEQLFYILMHEYTHFCNRDGAVKLLTLLLCCVFWWNPAVYLLKKDVEQILEIKCDVSSTRNFDKKERLEYLLTIVKVLKGGLQSKSVSSPLITMRLVSRTKHDDIKERFELITKATKQFGIRYQAAFIGFAVLLTALSYTFVLQSAFDPPEEDIYTDDSIAEWDLKNAHILQHRDMTYSLVLENDEMYPINDSFLQMCIDLGTEIRKE